MQKGRLWMQSDQENSIYSMRRYQKLPFFMKKRPKMAVLWSKMSFLASDKQLKTPPLF